VADWFHEFYYIVSPGENPQGPPGGKTKSLRGGSFDDSYSQVRTFNRFEHAPASPGINRGFRCASNADE
jgi:formylglycine-generating enzyme